METEVNFISSSSQSLKTDEGSLRFMISILAGYPLAIVYRKVFFLLSSDVQHGYFFICGLFLMYFNYGVHAIHSVINIICIYILLKTWGGKKISVIVALVFNMLYLLIGYSTTMSDGFVVRWATSHCVLTLRLTGLVMDVYDGHKKKEKLSYEQKESAISDLPSLLEMLGYSFFFGGVLVGPQYPMTRYRKFIDYTLYKVPNNSRKKCPASKRAACLRGLAGLLYLAAFQIGHIFYPDSFLLTNDFLFAPFWQKVIHILIWGKITLCKYVAVWLINEGICILCGISYNGKDTTGNLTWDGLSNIKIRRLEKSYCSKEFILAFNINTNQYSAKYIYKRLKFLGSKEISQACTLFYLAMWHGLHSGYLMFFLLEFLIVNFENHVRRIYNLTNLPHLMGKYPPLNWLRIIMMKIYAGFFLHYSLIPFNLFVFSKWSKVYDSMYWIVHITTVTCIFTSTLFRFFNRFSEFKSEK